MKIKDYSGKIYLLRDALKGEIFQSMHGEGQIEAMSGSIDRLAEGFALMFERMAEKGYVSDDDIINMVGYGSTIIRENDDGKS